MTLSEFLLARIDEDEPSQFAGVLIDGNEAPWTKRQRAECEAKRRIIELHSWMGPVMAGHPIDDPKSCVTCADHEQYGSPPLPWPCSTLRLLALPYADHPDYDESWRP